MKARHEFNYSEDYQRYIRLYIASQAMQGLLANHEQIGGTTNFEWLATNAVGCADELLKELSKTK